MTELKQWSKLTRGMFKDIEKFLFAKPEDKIEMQFKRIVVPFLFGCITSILVAAIVYS